MYICVCLHVSSTNIKHIWFLLTQNLYTSYLLVCINLTLLSNIRANGHLDIQIEIENESTSCRCCIYFVG